MKIIVVSFWLGLSRKYNDVRAFNGWNRYDKDYDR